MDINSLLADKAQKLSWDEPYPGLDKQGKTVTVNVAYSATAQDCINMQRAAQFKDGHGLDGADRQLLLDFISIHWAYQA